MAVFVEYKLTGSGWSECSVGIDEQQVSMTASYLSDALDSLLLAMIDLLRGSNDTTASFEEEPGEYRLRFKRVDEDKLATRILWFDEFGDPDEKGELLLDAECRLRTFVGAVLSASQKVLAENGFDGYRKKWVLHDFPAKHQRELKLLLAKR